MKKIKFEVNCALIKKLRQNAGIPQREMALLLGYKDKEQYNRLERGKARFKAEMLMELAYILDVNINDLFIPVAEEQQKCTA